MADQGLFHVGVLTHVKLIACGMTNSTASAMLRRLLFLFVGMVTGAEAPAPDRRCPAQTLFGTGIMISIVGGTQWMSLSAADNRYLPSDDHGGPRPWTVGQSGET